MKKLYSVLLTTFLLSIVFSAQNIYGQDKTKTDKDKDVKIQKSIDEQKKAMADQKKAQAEMEKNLEQQKELENSLDDVKREFDDVEDNAKIWMLPRGNRPIRFDGQPFVFAGGDMEAFGHFGDDERTTWDFSKSVKENTFNRDYTFDVEKTSKSVVMSVMGDCKEGEIRIKIIMPNGKSYSDILIDESGNLNWRKSFTITDTDNQDKTGNWKFQISSTKATGFFKISLQAY